MSREHRRRAPSPLGLGLLALLAAPPLFAAPPDPVREAQQAQADTDALRARIEASALPGTAGDIRLRIGRESGLPAYVSGAFRLGRGLAPEAHAKAFLRTVYGARVADALTLEQTLEDAIGFTHLRFHQAHGGLPIQSAEVWVHVDPAGVITSLGGDLAKPIRIPTEATLSEGDALRLAEDALRAEIDAPKAPPVPERARDFTPGAPGALVILAGVSAVDGRPALAWRLHLGPWQAFVDARSGALLRRTLEGDTLDLETWSGNGSQSSGQLQADTSPYTVSPDIDAEEAAAHASLIEYGTYLREVFGRESIDDAGLKLRQTVQYGTMSNAYWDGSSAYFGLGWATRDIVGHEFTHGLVQYTAGLVYQDAAGGLNESFADIFAVMIDRDDWLQGEEANGFSEANPVRSLSDPHKGDRFHPQLAYDRETNSGQPARFDEYVTESDPICGSTSDAYNGCVHFNSGIQNHVVYLTAEGGLNDGILVEAIGRPKVEQVYYRSLAYHLTSGSSYEAAREGAIEGCFERYGRGTRTCVAVQNAWAALGLGEVGTLPVVVAADGSGDFTTLAAAVEGTADGGLIWLQPGTYPESIALVDRILTIEGRGEVTLQGDGAAPTLSLTGGRIALAGLTLTGGGQGGIACAGATLYAEGVDLTGNGGTEGGGIDATDCALHLTDVEVRGNTASGDGGGISIAGGSLEAEGLTVLENVAGGSGGGLALSLTDTDLGALVVTGNSAGGDGGGISADTLTLRDVTLGGNTAGGEGGGIFAALADLTSVTLTGNEAEGDGGGAYITEGLMASEVVASGNRAIGSGGGLWWGGEGELRGSILRQNTAALGGGLALGAGATGSVSGSRIADNTATTGGGIYVAVGREELGIANAILAGNAAEAGGGLALGEGGLSVAFLTLTENTATAGSALFAEGGMLTGEGILLAGNGEGALATGAGGGISLSYSDTYGEGVAEGEGNIDADPLFVAFTRDGSGEADDLHLGAGSPCIDAGPPGEVEPDGSAADMGAYGGAGRLSWPGEYTPCYEGVTELTLGDIVSGTLSSTDATDGPRGPSFYHESYVFWAEAGTTATFLHAASYDAYLYLRSPTCAGLTSDDDGGGDLDSFIRYTFTAAGWYTVVATSYGDHETGPYTLTTSL